MSARADARTLALMARVARVRELQAKQALASAIDRKGVQQERTRVAEVFADRSDTALHGALAGASVDLARLPLLQELSAHVQATLEGERERLAENERQVADQAGIAGKRARQRERLEEKTTTANENQRRAHDARQLDFATEAWLARRHMEVA